MWYCLLQFTLILQVSTHFLAAYASVPIAYALAYALWLVAGLWIVGGLMEERTRDLKLEAARLILQLLLVLVSADCVGTLKLPAIAHGMLVTATPAQRAAP